MCILRAVASALRCELLVGGGLRPRRLRHLPLCALASSASTSPARFAMVGFSSTPRKRAWLDRSSRLRTPTAQCKSDTFCKRSALQAFDRRECASIVQWQQACKNLLHRPEAGAKKRKTPRHKNAPFLASHCRCTAAQPCCSLAHCSLARTLARAHAAAHSRTFGRSTRSRTRAWLLPRPLCSGHSGARQRPLSLCCSLLVVPPPFELRSSPARPFPTGLDRVRARCACPRSAPPS